MKISSVKNLLSFLDEEGLKAKKSFSQNFLVDDNILKKITSAAHVQKGDVIVEIGPGPGALTQKLLEAGAIVIAIELDKGFSAALFRLQTPDHRLHILEKDALTIDYPQLLAPFIKGGKKAKVVANLPYAITTPLLATLLPLEELFETLILMIQKEVADRIRSTQGKNTSSLSVFTRIYSDFSYAFTVEPSCFYPKPKVKSAVVCFSLKKPPAGIDLPLFFLFMRKGFSQRRKMLTTIFKEILPKEELMQALEELGLNPSARAEEVSPDLFVALFKKVATSVLSLRKELREAPKV